MCFRTHAVSISPSLSLLIGLLISLRNIIRIQSLSLFDARDGVRPLFLFNPLLRNVSACDSTSTQKPFKRGGYVVLLNSKVLRSVLQDTRNTGEEVPMDYASTSTIWNTNVRRRWHIWLNRQWKILDSWERTVFFFSFQSVGGTHTTCFVGRVCLFLASLVSVSSKTWDNLWLCTRSSRFSRILFFFFFWTARFSRIARALTIHNMRMEQLRNPRVTVNRFCQKRCRLMRIQYKQEQGL